mgnify:CR=1 FL=1
MIRRVDFYSKVPNNNIKFQSFINIFHRLINFLLVPVIHFERSGICLDPLLLAKSHYCSIPWSLFEFPS